MNSDPGNSKCFFFTPNDVYLRLTIPPTTMVKSKTELFDPEISESAALFKAISHPARIAILRYLAETRTCITGDISQELPLSRTTVNQHLAELKKAGLIQGRIDGAKTKYCLNPDGLQKLKKMSEKLLNQIGVAGSVNC